MSLYAIPGEASVPEPMAQNRLLLARERVLALDQRLPILVIEAPSGFGKSVLAGMWLEQRRQAGAHGIWVTLDSGSRDPMVFLNQVVHALGGAVDEKPVSPILDYEAECVDRFATLSHFLEAKPPLSMVIDDVHVLSGSPSRVWLEKLLKIADDDFRVCITLRPIALEIGLGGLTGQGRVSWIHAGSLALTQEEVGALALARGQHLSAVQLDWLFRATEGWPALVQLALGVSLQATPSIEGGIADLGPIREYIYERLLGELSLQERGVLWNLACLGSAPMELLDALGICSDSASSEKLSSDVLDRILLRFASLGIVQNAQTQEGAMLSLHPLVREGALRFLGQGRAAERQRLLENAADWYWRQGKGPAAVRLLLDPGCGGIDRARDWLNDLGFSLVFHLGQHQTLLDLLDSWEKLSQRVDPDLNSLALWALILQRRFDLADARIARVRVEPGVVSIGTLQRAVLAGMRDDHVAAGRLAQEWMQGQDEKNHSFNMGVASCVYAFSQGCSGQIEEAQVTLRKVHQCFGAVQSDYGFGWARVTGAMIGVRAGHYRDALTEVERGLSQCRHTHEFGRLQIVLGAIGAFLRYERNELANVREMLGETLPQLAEQGIVDSIVLGYAAAARSRAAAGDFGTALDILAEGEALGLQREFMRQAVCLRAERALLLARSGATGQARALIDVPIDITETHSCYRILNDRALRLRIRLALLEGDPRQARDWLVPLIAHVRAVGSRNKLCELLLLLACAEDAEGKEANAFAAIAEAYDIGSVEGYVRTFLDEGPALRSLSERWLGIGGKASKPALSLATHLLELDWGISGPTPKEASIPVLGKRELQILRLLDQGLSNSQIAARCFISEGTVKWYLHNLYEKLGVGNRTALLRVARDKRIGI